MSDDLIKRQDAIDAILDLSDFVSVIELFEYVEDHDLRDSRSGGIIDTINAVLLLPSAQPERKTGRWEEYLKEGLRWKCSECGSRFDFPFDFCPHCGADMRGDQDG